MRGPTRKGRVTAPKTPAAGRKPLPSLILGLLIGMFVAGAAAMLLWPSEQTNTKSAPAVARKVDREPVRPPAVVAKAPAAPAPALPSVRPAPAKPLEPANPPAVVKPAPAEQATAASTAANDPPPQTIENSERSSELTLAAIPRVEPSVPPARATWLRNAVPAAPAAGRPMIAVVLDDVGLNRSQSRRAVALPGPLTLSYLTYAEELPQQTAAARAAGHELMLHFPMEPLESSVSPGPEALLVSADPAELRRRLNWGLSRFDGFVGVNNHMGSRFTQNEAGMSLVLTELDRRGLLFLDSVTSGRTVGGAVAARLDLPFAKRDVFLDHRPDRASVRASLAELERKAKAQGHAIGIGHPRVETIDVLAEWLPTLEARGYALVPVTTIVKHLRDQAHRRNEAAVPPPRG